MPPTIRDGIPPLNNAKDFLETISLKFKESEKAEMGFRIKKLTDMRYEGDGCESWTLDDGATIHVSNSLQGFTTKRVPTKDEIKVYVDNGIQVKVEFIGDIKIRLESG
ncbi:unnamed protein product [Prunus brigantina]